MDNLLLQLGLLFLVIAGCLSEEASSEGCGDLQKLRVKSDWAASYSYGRERANFALSVWNVFLKAHPEYQDLFDAVGGDDTRSAQFAAHMARVLGGVDAIISVLENDEVLAEVLRHYAEFHKKYGRLPYEEFGEALATLMGMGAGSGQFNKTIWMSCFEMIGQKMAEAARIRQSPIDIIGTKTVTDPSLRIPWVMTYPPANTKNLFNNGHTVQVAIDFQGTELSGGALGSKKFCLEQFHFHWGSVNSQGSEHTVEGYAYPAEVHLVHWNCERYSSFSEAIPSEDGLTVLGVFLQLGDEPNAAMKILTDNFGSIKYKGQSVDLSPFDPTGLLPDDITSFWNYPGSLTTPPYSETVNWIVFKDPITVTQEQLDEFRHLVTYEEGAEPDDHSDDGHHSGPLVDNYRETQPLFGRVIKASFLSST